MSSRSKADENCKHCGDNFSGYSVPSWLSEPFCSYECRNIHMAGLTHMPSQKTKPDLEAVA